MTYEETINYLFEAAPLFQQIGGGAYKEGLSTTFQLDDHFGHPHQQFCCIHVGGTNGKGSTANTLAAMLQHAGYKTGLFTSPHLIDFRERIRVNGQMIDKKYVIDFVENERAFFEPLSPSFFEITTALAFKYFADQEIDVAVIEVGLGGRLDCTNIIQPVLSVITNISFDHTQFLGHTLAAIASEKAGIIKTGVPVVIGETVPETRKVFEKQAIAVKAPITFAEESEEIISTSVSDSGLRHYITSHWGTFDAELAGDCQVKNANTILHAVEQLQSVFTITTDDVHYAFRHICEITGLKGRWQKLQEKPMVICDAGHNPGGWTYLSRQLHETVKSYGKVRIVLGFAADKDVTSILSTLPTEAQYYWSRASVRRAMDEKELKQQADTLGLSGNAFSSVSEAYQQALSEAAPSDFIYVGGSCFVVADLLSSLI